MKNQIKFKYDKRTAGTRVSIILIDDEVCLEPSLGEFRGWEKGPDCSQFVPADTHNLSVLKAIIDALIKRGCDGS